MSDPVTTALLEAELARVRAELQPFLDAKKEAEERDAKFTAWIAKLGPEKDPTEAEREAINADFSDMFRPCETCGRSGFSALDDEQCKCCGRCLLLRGALGRLLELHAGDTRSAVEDARRAYFRTDPRDWQIWELSHRFKEMGLVTQPCEYPDFRARERGWILRVGDKIIDGVIQNQTVIKRADAVKPWPLRATMLWAQRDEKDFNDTELLFESVVDDYRRAGLIPPSG